MRENMWVLSFWDWVSSLNIFSKSLHFLSMWPSYPSPGQIFKDSISYHRNTLHIHVSCHFIHGSKETGPDYTPINRRMANKKCDTYSEWYIIQLYRKIKISGNSPYLLWFKGIPLYTYYIFKSTQLLVDTLNCYGLLLYCTHGYFFVSLK